MKITPKKILYYLRTFIMALIGKAFGKSDKGRWKDDENLKCEWNSRTKIIAELVKPHSSVLEFGAGNMVLKEYLPDGCDYTPSDIEKRAENMIECDLNSAELPHFDYRDTIVFSGVLEYIDDIDRLLAHLCGSCGYIVASYAILPKKNIKELIFRRLRGWVNDYTYSQIIKMFDKHGLEKIDETDWEDQKIFVFQKKNDR